MDEETTPRIAFVSLDTLICQADDALRALFAACKAEDSRHLTVAQCDKLWHIRRFANMVVEVTRG